MPNPIIYINSWPGVGKHTIAKELGLLLGDDTRVVHNHLHIDLAGAILPRSSSDYLKLRHQLRASVFNTLVTSADTYNYTYIFTDFQSTDEVGSSVAEEYADAAKRRGCIFVPIVLSCDTAENKQRMRSRERLRLGADGKGILLDTTLLMDIRGCEHIYSFKRAEELLLDVTSLKAKEAAAKILEHLKAVTYYGEALIRRQGN